jgi:DNA-binding PadR family transcriptional regulator
MRSRCLGIEVFDLLRYIAIHRKGVSMTAYAIHSRRCHRDEGIHLMSGRHGRRRRGGPFGPGYAFGRRAGRGDIRAAILAILAEEPMHGYQIIQELAERTGGVWRPSPGSVYPTLQQLEDEELVRAAASESGKRVFELTDAGREQASASPAPWSAVAGESESELVVLRDLAHQVLAATRQVAHAGTAAQIEAAQVVLRDARRALYRLLAEEGD